MDLPEQIMKKLACSHCNRALSVFPVYSYDNGEFVCGRCPRIDDQKPSRDFSYETFAEHVNFPCVYKTYGCIESLTPSELKLHEPRCFFKQWFCIDLTTYCNWEGMLSDLEEHYEETHSALVLEEFQKFNFVNNADVWEKNFLLKAIQEIFMVQVKKTNENLYINVCLIGQKRASRLYNYSVSIYSKSQEDGLDFTKNKVQQNTGERRIDQNKSYAIDLDVLKIVKGETLECEVLITRDIEFIEEPKTLSSFNEYILKHIECPVCFEYMSAPIFQCCNGHVICQDCKLKSNQCPSCREVIGNIRNRVLEEITENSLYTCRFEGCTCVYNYQDKRKHESECKYAPYQCPFNRCAFKSNYSGMFDHFSKTHFDDFLQTPSLKIYFNCGYNNMCALKKNNCLFIAKHSVNNNVFSMGVAFFGPKGVENNFDFVFDIRNAHTGERIYTKMNCMGMEEFGTANGQLQLSVDMLSRYTDDICATGSIYIMEQVERDAA